MGVASGPGIFSWGGWQLYRRPWQCLIISNEVTLFEKECKGSTELVNED